jgi:Mlc titration factor MtfA (ptsG expression regulator)
MGIFSFFKSRRRLRILAHRRIDDETWRWIMDEHPILGRLSESEAPRLRDMAEIFAAEKKFVPIDGMKIEPDMILSISVQAVLPALNLGIEWLEGFTTVFVGPGPIDMLRRSRLGPVIEERTERVAGQVDSLGPIFLSWRDVEASGWGDGFNVVVHEIAHKLDLSNREMDGCPFLDELIDPARWRRVFSAAYDDLSGRLERGGDRDLPINAYGAESPVEFFAVACEEFFERPSRLAHYYPEVYTELSVFLKQDPLAAKS